jgi:hypothetical protein
MSSFANRLVLAPWALRQLGAASFDDLKKLLASPEYEGWGKDGLTLYTPQLISRIPAHKRPGASDEQLRDYDANIVRHWKAITTKRNANGPTLYPTYFQYLGLLLTEIYLDRYFRDPDALLASLNQAVHAANGAAGAREQLLPYTAGDLNKLAFWMATGSGKTLLMHCHIRQYLHYAGRANRRHELNKIILLTPNESLSRQHRDEFALSGIEAELFDRNGPTLFSGRGVDIIDIHKLGEATKEKVIAISEFEGRNLVLVDEGHRGASGDEWLDKRAALCADGFSFEYSATFGQAIKAAGTATPPREGKPVSKGYTLTQTYARCILFDYSYRFFYDDGYGKDYNILNLAETKEDETRPLYLTACLLSFYQQCRRYEDGRTELAPYLLDSPLLVLVGGSVAGQRQSQEDTDLVLVLKFLAEFIANRAESVARLRTLLARQDGLVVGGARIFDRFFPYVEQLWKPAEAEPLFKDILGRVFNAPGGGQLHIVRLQGADGEIGLRIGENPWFGVVNVGDAKALSDLCLARKTGDDHYVVEDRTFSGSLFEEIKKPGSAVRVLAGAKKFTEGWSSWRVSSMGLMNVGKKEGSEIIQLFGRGVRLRGYKHKLKRTAMLDAMDLQSEDAPTKHPDHIQLLETLNIFGVRADYMKTFQEYLEEEDLGEDDQRELIVLPTLRLPEIETGKLQLSLIRKRSDAPDFKKERRLVLSSLEGKLSNLVVSDWYPRLQKQSSLGGVATAASVHHAKLRADHLAFLDWNRVWFEVERFKKEKAFYNILFGPPELKALMAQNWWYELSIPPAYLEFRLERIPLWQEIVVQLLNGYVERFYLFHKKEFEAPYLEYHTLGPKDELLLEEYRLLIRKSEKQLITRLRDLAEKFRAGTFEAYSFDRFHLFRADTHLYQPLIHLTHAAGATGADSLIKVVPTHLNEGEKDFVDKLEAYCKAEAQGRLAGIELYLLRNHNSDKAISFFTESGFRPDFILWLLRDSAEASGGTHQTIAFIDPKGLRNFTDNFNNPKVRLAADIKTLEKNLKRPEIRLESFLVSQTHRNALRWPDPSNPKEDALVETYRKHHVLNAKDEPDTYVSELIELTL